MDLSTKPIHPGTSLKGDWNANANTPTLADGVGVQGDFYRVAVTGAQDLGSGSQKFKLGEEVKYNGAIWQRVGRDSELSEDLTPQLGGDLDVNGKQFTGDGNFVNRLTIESREAEMEGDNVRSVYALTDLPDAVTAVRTLLANFEYIIKLVGLSLSDRFQIPDAATNNLRAQAFNINTLTYTGSATLFTGGAVGFFQFFSLTTFGNGAATLFDIVGGALPAKQVSINESRFDNFLSLGTLKNIGFASSKSAYLNNASGITLFNCPELIFSLGPMFNFSDLGSTFITIDGDIDIIGSISNITIATFPGESAINIRPNIGDNSSITIEGVKFQASIFTPFLGDVFWQGVTGAITAIADASIGSTAITSVTDSGGVARFNFTGPTVHQYQKVTISGFITNTPYNVTGIITATDGTTYFEISRIPFGTDEATGSFLSDSITITSAAHGQANGQGLSIKETVNHNVGSYAYNVQTNTFQVNKAFVATETGIWDTSSLDQTDPRVTSVQGNAGLDPSQTKGSFISQGNNVATVISAIGEGESGYVDLNLGQANGAITAYSDNGAGGTTVAAAAHGQPDERLVGIKGSANYSGQHEIYNVLAGSFDIDIPFVGDDGASTWETGAFSGGDIEGWELVDGSNGTLKYIGLPDLGASALAVISAVAVGGSARRFKFILVTSDDGGLTWKDGFSIPADIKNDVTTITFQKGFRVKRNTLAKMRVANFETTADIIIDTISLTIQ